MTHGFRIPQFDRRGRVIARGSNTRNRDDRRASVDSSGKGIVGWKWNNATHNYVPVRE
jgi:hypothetical protein